MAQWVKAIAAKPDNLISKANSHNLSSATQMQAMAHTQAHTSTYRETQKKNLKNTLKEWSCAIYK